MLEHAELLRWLHYDPLTGLFSWLGHPCGKYVTIGRPTGTVCSVTGYIKITVFGKTYLGHRLAWFWMTGSWPPVKVDHEDRSRANNRWINLRLATSLQSSANIGMKKQNKVGLKGVIRSSCKKKFCAQVSKNYRSTHIGTFDCPAAAHFAYLIEAHKTFGEFA